MPPKPFNPPRPSGITKKPAKPKPTTARKSTDSTTDKARSKPGPKPKARAAGSTSFSRPLAISSPAASDSDPLESPSRDVEDEVGIEAETEEDRTEHIPPDLLTRLLHESFKEEGTRISKDANKAVGRYMETFVREALARAAFMRAEGEGGFLEVEDLEKLAPQLLLDF